MFKTVYRLRLYVQETGQSFPIHLFAIKNKEPTIDELMNKINQITKDQHSSDYCLKIIDTDTILCDNETLRHALKESVFNESNLEIVLKRNFKKDNETNQTKLLGLDDLNLRRYSTTTFIPFTTRDHNHNHLPVIKPTVPKWTSTILSKDFQLGLKVEDDSSDDEQVYKKQRVMSEDHLRRLPDPLSSPSLRYNNNNNISFGHPIVHPLEIRRPSTAPLPSPPNIKSQLTLPALSSITSTVQQSFQSHQLAPIIHHNPKKRSRSQPSTLVFICEHVNNHGKTCGQTFRRSYDLSRHQTIHLENRPFYSCDLCDKRFTRMDALRRHERVQGHSPKHRSMSAPTFKTTSV